MMYLFFIAIVVSRLAVLVIAADDAKEESFNLWKDNQYKQNINPKMLDILTSRINYHRKKNQHWYFSIDRVLVYILLTYVVWFSCQYLAWWQIASLVVMDLGINLGWFKFWHDGLIKLFYNNLDSSVYTERFWAYSDNQSDASTDKWFPDTPIHRMIYLALSVTFTAIQLALFVTWA